MLSLENYEALMKYYINNTRYCIYMLDLKELDGVKNVWDMATYYRWLNLVYDNLHLFHLNLHELLDTVEVVRKHRYAERVLAISYDLIKQVDFINEEVLHHKEMCFKYLDGFDENELKMVKSLL